MPRAKCPKKVSQLVPLKTPVCLAGHPSRVPSVGSCLQILPTILSQRIRKRESFYQTRTVEAGDMCKSENPHQVTFQATHPKEGKCCRGLCLLPNQTAPLQARLSQPHEPPRLVRIMRPFAMYRPSYDICHRSALHPAVFNRKWLVIAPPVPLCDDQCPGGSHVGEENM